MEYLPVVATCAVGLINGGIALIVWGLRAEVKSLRTEVALGLAEAENRFFLRVNGNYVRKELYAEMHERIGRIEDRIE